MIEVEAAGGAEAGVIRAAEMPVLPQKARTLVCARWLSSLPTKRYAVQAASVKGVTS